MTREDHAACVAALERALDSEGIIVARGDFYGGNLRTLEPLSADAILGRWLQNGWWVYLNTGPSPLHMVQEDDDE